VRRVGVVRIVNREYSPRFKADNRVKYSTRDIPAPLPTTHNSPIHYQPKPSIQNYKERERAGLDVLEIFVRRGARRAVKNLSA